MKSIYQNTRRFWVLTFFRHFFVCILLCFQSYFAVAQCPPNIDFEERNFNGWECWTGNTALVGVKNIITWDPGSPGAPVANRHTILSSVPGNGLDPFGLFPQNCPNGSGHSIKLGNSLGGHQAEGVSYTFTIPPTLDKFNLIYNYAVVFQDPNHPVEEQPRLKITVENLTDSTEFTCSSFPFVATSGLPGFFLSTTNTTGTPVWCKSWSANSVNLDGLQGKTIRLFFTTADCIYTAHFGYAYIDVNSQCGSSFVGATFCPDDTAVNVTGPAGYQSYRWFNNNFSSVLGTTQTLTLNPPPLAGDSIFVELTPYNGYGCLDTLTANLWDTLTVVANAGVDRATCDNNPVQLGNPPEPGRVYRWAPATGLSDPNIANPIATPALTTNYTLTVTNSGGGCATTDNVLVDVDILSDSIQQIGPSAYCTASGQSVSLRVLPHDSIQWYRNNIAIIGAQNTQYNVTQTGAYYAMVFSNNGCSRTTVIKQIDIWESPVAGFTSNNITQCFNGNQFVFTNTSTLATGVLQYNWSLGDGTILNNANINYSYAKEGSYTVKLVVTAPGGCADSSNIDVLVNPSPKSAFDVDTPTQCFKNNVFAFANKSTVPTGILTYTWDFGDGTFSNNNNSSHTYALPGSYAVKLTATETGGGCSADSTVTVLVNASPVASFGVNLNPQCFPGHSFILTDASTIIGGAMQYTWDMGDGIVRTTSGNQTYSYAKAGNYLVKLLLDAAGGCKDSMLLDVIVHPVPTADFSIETVCENLRVPVYNRTFNNTTSTVNYFWDFGNGHLDTTKTPMYSYPVGGSYSVSLSVSTAQCPVSFNTKTIAVTIDVPEKGIVYADKDAAFNFPEPLTARAIGNNVIWTPPTSLSNRFSYTPSFTGITPQLYTIQLKTATGCITVDTQLVKTHKKIEIYVPTGFTPNGNGINDRLRPVLIGFNKVNYFRVYNRWGKLLFSMNSDKPGWDGNEKGKPTEMQTVVWMIEAVDVDGKVHNKQGSTVIIR